MAHQEGGWPLPPKIQEMPGHNPTFLTRELLTVGRESEWYLTFANSGYLTDVFTKVKFPYANNSSMNGFRTPRGTTVIDHIFMTKHFTAAGGVY